MNVPDKADCVCGVMSLAVLVLVVILAEGVVLLPPKAERLRLIESVAKVGIEEAALGEGLCVAWRVLFAPGVILIIYVVSATSLGQRRQ